MARRILLLGVKASVVEDVRQELQLPGTEFLGGTGADDVRAAFGQADIDHVIVGGGLDLAARPRSCGKYSSQAIGQPSI